MIAVRFRDGGIPIELGATIKGDLSVLTAVVENIGLDGDDHLPGDQKGNLGPANLALGFKPPNGVGLSHRRRRGQGRRLPVPRLRQGRVRRRARADVRRDRVAQGDRPHHHQDARTASRASRC